MALFKQGNDQTVVINYCTCLIMSLVVDWEKRDFASPLSLWYTMLSFNKTSLEVITPYVYQTYIRRPRSGSHLQFEVGYNEEGFCVKSDKPLLCLWMLALS